MSSLFKRHDLGKVVDDYVPGDPLHYGWTEAIGKIITICKEPGLITNAPDRVDCEGCLDQIVRMGDALKRVGKALAPASKAVGG